MPNYHASWLLNEGKLRFPNAAAVATVVDDISKIVYIASGVLDMDGLGAMMTVLPDMPDVASSVPTDGGLQLAFNDSLSDFTAVVWGGEQPSIAFTGHGGYEGWRLEVDLVASHWRSLCTPAPRGKAAVNIHWTFEELIRLRSTPKPPKASPEKSATRQPAPAPAVHPQAEAAFDSRVWTSELLSDYDLGEPPGLRHKWFGEPWEAPYVRDAIPKPSERVREALFSHGRGLTVTSDQLPEATAVYSHAHFNRVRDVFYIGSFLAVKGKVAKVLSQFDLGDGGGLIPHSIFEADEMTPLPGPFYIVNYGPQKDCFLPQETTKKRLVFTDSKTGREYWRLEGVKDGDVAVSAAALVGADLWRVADNVISPTLFMSDRLAHALLAIAGEVRIDFALRRCRVID